MYCLYTVVDLTGCMCITTKPKRNQWAYKLNKVDNILILILIAYKLNKVDNILILISSCSCSMF